MEKNMGCNKMSDEMECWIEQAVAGDNDALEKIIAEIQDMVFNLFLRMLGTIADAEDASQEILIKVITHLASFRKESEITTWVFRIAVNHLKDYKKNMFSKHPLSFEFYGQDIASGKEQNLPDLSAGADREMLEQELKLSCSNVMLQCLDPESRCIFILGTMFQVDSRIAGAILNISAEAYRKRLSRIRRKMADFMEEYCGLSGKGMCSCAKRIDYAIMSHRLNPKKAEYLNLRDGRSRVLENVKNAMEKVDDLTFIYAELPFYRAGREAKEWLETFLTSKEYKTIVEA